MVIQAAKNARCDEFINQFSNGYHTIIGENGSKLSGGERQRVGIARAIVKNPSIIIADEPTGNLDSKNSVEVMNIIKAISKEKLVILVTHETNLAKFYASRIIELEDGKIVADPVGNLSSSFMLKAQVILAEKEYMRQVSNIFKKVGIDIDGLVPVTLAERNLVLDTNELSDNVMLLDVGAGNTDIGVFEGSSFVYTNTIPLGGDSITSDIALVLNIGDDEADRLKKQYGLAMKSFIDNDNEILL